MSRHTTSAGQAPEFNKGRVSLKIRTARSPNTAEDASLWKVTEATAKCTTTRELIKAVKAGKSIKELPAKHPGKDLADVWNEMGVESTSKGEVLVINQKLYIPKDIRRELLQGLYSTGTCSEKMWRTVRGIWMWSALKNEIRSYVSQCPSCAETARSKAHQPPP